MTSQAISASSFVLLQKKQCSCQTDHWELTWLTKKLIHMEKFLGMDAFNLCIAIFNDLFIASAFSCWDPLKL